MIRRLGPGSSISEDFLLIPLEVFLTPASLSFGILEGLSHAALMLFPDLSAPYLTTRFSETENGAKDEEHGRDEEPAPKHVSDETSHPLLHDRHTRALDGAIGLAMHSSEGVSRCSSVMVSNRLEACLCRGLLATGVRVHDKALDLRTEWPAYRTALTASAEGQMRTSLFGVAAVG